MEKHWVVCEPGTAEVEHTSLIKQYKCILASFMDGYKDK